jgi:kynureninase
MAVSIGDKVGALIGAEQGSISLHQNVTITQAIISSCFNYSTPRNKVVMVDLEFPSIIYFYTEQQRQGARVEIVKSEDGIHAPLERFLAAIDETTLLVPISYVLFRSASIVDAARSSSAPTRLVHSSFLMRSRRQVRFHSMYANSKRISLWVAY